MRTIFAALLLVCLGWQHATAQTLIVQPYLQPGTSAEPTGDDSKRVLWFTDQIASSNYVVEYGWPDSAVQTAQIEQTVIAIPAPTPEQLKKKTTAILKDPAAPVEQPPVIALGDRAQNYVKYVATLKQLPRDQKAWYRVKQGTQVINEQQFKTRASSQQPVRFVAVGDLANGKTGQDRIAFQISQVKPNFVLALGDIVYSNGRVSQYLDHYWRTYLHVPKPSPTTGAPLMANVPFYVVLGNHDMDSNLNAYPDCLGAYYFFQAPLNGPGPGPWNTPISRSQQEAAMFQKHVGNAYPSLGFYSFDEGPVHCLVLDNCGYVKLDQPELLQWIKQDLAASNAKWKAVCYHAPAFHSSPAHYTEQKSRLLSPVLEQGGVDIVFSGHVHNYQRSYPLRFAPVPPEPGVKLVNGKFTIDAAFDGVKQTKPNGVIHVVSGGGGANLYMDPVTRTAELMTKKFGDNWAPYTAKHVVDRHSLVYCDVTTSQLTLVAVDQEGHEIDRIQLTK